MAALAKGRKDLVFPRTYLGKDSLDFSFSGIKTAVLYYVQKSAPKGLLVSEIANAFQEAVLNVLAEKAFLAAKVTGAKTVVVGGGVAANSRLREIFSEGAGFKGCAVCFPRKEYCLDNAAMIGAFGEALYRKGYGSDLYLSAEPSLSAKIRPNRRSARRKI
jgi:N6-L-threonylcarbamoyladenine synthase